MARYRNALPQLNGDLFLTDGGLETTLIFLDGLELPEFAAFDLLKTRSGEATLDRYFRTYAELARQLDTGLILESATWRASPDWAAKLGHTRQQLADLNRKAIRMLDEIRRECEADGITTVVSGCVGPRGDGYVPGKIMSAREAEDFHGEQIRIFATTEADMVCAITMNYTEEAIGVANAARSAAMPVAISFTVETDGRLPNGQSLEQAIEAVDQETSGAPAYYMINCAHPSHFDHVLDEGGEFLARIRGVRANASRMSHAELNESPTLDAGDPADLGARYARLKESVPHLNVLGGCCGTDRRHVEAIAQACLPYFG